MTKTPWSSTARRYTSAPGSSGTLDLLVLHPAVATWVLAGGCLVYRCATCGAELDAAGAIAHQDLLPSHEVQGFVVLNR